MKLYRQCLPWQPWEADAGALAERFWAEHPQLEWPVWNLERKVRRWLWHPDGLGSSAAPSDVEHLLAAIRMVGRNRPVV